MTAVDLAAAAAALSYRALPQDADAAMAGACPVVASYRTHLT